MFSALELRLVAIALAVAALLAGYAAWHHHVTSQQHDADVAQQRAADARQTALNQAIRDAQAKTQQENADDTTRFDARRVADARDLDAGIQRLHVAAAAVRATPAASSGAACASTAASVPGAACVSTELYLGLVDVARDIAGRADCLESGGELCARDYDALTPGAGSGAKP